MRPTQVDASGAARKEAATKKAGSYEPAFLLIGLKPSGLVAQLLLGVRLGVRGSSFGIRASMA